MLSDSICYLKYNIVISHVITHNCPCPQADPAADYEPVAENVLSRYFDPAQSPEDADFAIFFMESPKSWRMGYDPADKESGGNGYIPITLQYRPYTAVNAREISDERTRRYAGR